jgi:hypothetical protein
MFVSESLNDILKPKSLEDINLAKKNLDVEEKQKILFNIGFNRFKGSYNDFFEFLETELKDVGFWTSLIDIVTSSVSNNIFFTPDVDKNWILNNVSYDDLLEFSLDMLSEENIDKVLSKLIPGY